jgi:hypothetical protein
MTKWRYITLILFAVSATALSGMLVGALAAVSESEKYKIQTDSVNIGGIEYSRSDNFFIKDTLGEISTGKSSSESFILRAGYRQMQETFISINSPGDVTMSPSIPGISGGTGNGQASWTVITDNMAGYSLSLKASSTPTLLCASGDCTPSSDNFADYTPATPGTPDYDWSITTTDAEFGFSPEGAGIVQKFQDNGSACNTGSSDTTDKCWYNLGTSTETIVSTTSSNHPSGTATTVKFQAQSGSSNVQSPGTYSAAITATATAL